MSHVGVTAIVREALFCYLVNIGGAAVVRAVLYHWE